MKNHLSIDPSALSPLQRGPLCHRYRKASTDEVHFSRLVDAALLVILITLALSLAL